MRLAKLAPEATRLRRMGRAHASGELTRREYRAARRDIIAGFAVAQGNSPIDETQKRQRPVDPSVASSGSSELISTRTAALCALLFALVLVVRELIS